MTINFIQKKSFKEKFGKALSIVVGVTTVLNVSMVWALVPTAQAVPPPLPNFAAVSWSPYQLNGHNVTDYEDNVCGINDSSHGPANVAPDSVDLASNAIPDPCPPGQNPGTAPTLFTGADADYFYFRVRLADTPLSPGGGAKYDSYHWDVLIDTNNDHYSNYVFDLFGTSSVFGSGSTRKGALGLYKNDPNAQTYDPNVPANVVWQAEASATTDLYTNLSVTPENALQYFLDLALPKSVAPFTSYANLFASTSASNTDPLQKDWMSNEAFFLELTQHKSVVNLTRPGALTVSNPVKPGDTLRYTLTVANTGTIAAPAYIVTDDLSDLVDYTGAPFNISNTGSYNGTTHFISWPAVTINPATTITRTFDVTVKPYTEWPGSGDFDITNVYGDRIDLKLCNLTITKSVNKTSVQPGDQITYTVNYSNTGTANCTGTGVRIDDAIPAGSTYVNGSNTQNVTGDTDGQGIDFGYGDTKFSGFANPTGYNGTYVSWNAHTVSPGESGTVTFKVTANALAECGQADITNKAKIYSDQFTAGIESNMVTTHSTADCFTTLTVIKHVVNDNGGTKNASDFQLHISGTVGNHDVTGAEAPGVTVNVNPGTYNVTEDPVYGYAASYSANCSGTLNPGDDKVCTVTNNDIQPKLTVTKVVVNDNGGTKQVSDFPLFVGTASVTSGVENGFNAGPYVVSETQQFGYDSAITGDCDTNGNVRLSVGDDKHCTITNDDIAPLLTVTKTVVNDNGGNNSAPDFTMNVTGTNVSNPSFAGSEAGTTVTLDQGSYGVDESPFSGYTKTLGTDCVGTISVGEHKYCTITNDDQSASITLIKSVTNNNGGTAGVNDFGLTIGGIAVNSGDTRNVNANTAIALNEAGLFGYNFVSLTGDAKCPTVLGGTATLNEGEHITCTITNDDVAPLLTVTKYVNNSNGGTAVPSDFTMNVTGSSPAPASFPGSSTGTLVVLNTGSYNVTESGPSGYSPAFSADCTGSLSVGEHKYCVVTNTAIAPQLVVIKHVINDNGGTKEADDFTMNVTGTHPSPASFPGSEAGTSVTIDLGSFSVDENYDAGYAKSFSGDCSGTIALGEVKFCTITNDDIAPELTVIKHVVNDNGGNNTAPDFTMNVTGTNVSDPSFAGSEAGTTVTLNQGSYGVDESPFSGYTKTLGTDCVGTINVGEHKYCTITNDDQSASITLIKSVTNNNGGTAGVNDFGLTIGGTPVNSGDTLNVNANAAIALNEAGLFGYNFVSLTGNAKCPTVLGGTATLNEGEHVTCTITNDDIAPQLTVIKYVSNNHGGNNVPADFTMNVTGTNVSDPSFPGDDAGTTVTLDAGSYAVDETGPSGYTANKSPDCTGSIAVGQHKTCTIINWDIAPMITLNKVVNNNHGGTADVNDFGLTVGGTSVDSGQTIHVNSNTPIALDEAGLFGYQFVSISGDAGCPSVLGGTVTLNEGEYITCTITNEDVQPTLTVTKVVNNNHGGNAVVGDFPLFVGTTSVTSGTQNGFNAGAYLVSESQQTGYTLVSITGDCDTNGNVSLAVGENKACTITNEDIAPRITLIKDVIKDNGGTAGVNDFGLTIGGTPMNSGDTLDVNANTPIALNEAGLTGYSFVNITGDEECPSVLGGTVTLDESAAITCTIHNDDIAPQLNVVKHVVLNGYEQHSAADFTMNVTGANVSNPSFAGSESGTTVTLNQGSYSVDEAGTPVGYTKSLSADCSGTIYVGNTKTCTIENTRDTGTIIVHKQIDTNGDGTVDVTDDAVATSTYGFMWSLDGGATNRNMGSNATVTTLDTHTVSENTVPNYHYVGYFIGEGTCNDPSVQQLPVSFTVAKNGETHVTLCNARDTGTLIVKKHVINNDGGQKVAIDFTMDIAGVTVLGTSSFPGEEAGTTRTVTTGVYNVTETQLPGYTASFSADCAGTLAFGETKTCTITNDDIVSTIGLVKTATPAVVSAGGNITYTLAWSVTGVNPVHDAIITDPIPANTTFVTAGCGTTTGTCTINSATSTVSWSLGTRNAGESGTVTLVVKTASPITNGTVITNTGTFDTTETPPVTSTAVTPVTSAPDLTIVKTVSVAPPSFTNPGKAVTYTVVVTNKATATDTAKNVVLTDTLPAGFTFASDGTTTKSFPIGNLAPGQSATVTYLVNISGTQTAGTYNNFAKAKGDNTSEVTAVAPVEVRIPTVLAATSPDLTITKVANKKTVKPKDIVTYAITIKNIGDGDATNVVVTDTLPSGLSYVNITGKVATWYLGTLKPGHTREINVDVRVNSTAKEGNYTNVATVTADDVPQKEAQATVTVPKVLGLATTGIGFRDYLIMLLGVVLVAVGALGLRSRERQGVTA
ncbi:MAG: NEW3 domain-containing protein [Candidatus Kerfeldbacteria bacterium]